MKKNKLIQGFTLVEIMIVVAIIGILAAIAIPNFLKSRTESQMKACIANLKQIEGAQEQSKLAGNPEPTEAQVQEYLKQNNLTCPTSKTEYNLATDPPVCPTNVDNHALPN